MSPTTPDIMEQDVCENIAKLFTTGQGKYATIIILMQQDYIQIIQSKKVNDDSMIIRLLHEKKIDAVTKFTFFIKQTPIYTVKEENKFSTFKIGKLKYL